MANYNITVDDALTPGLQQQLDQINAQALLQNSKGVADIAALLQNAAIGLAQQGMNAIAQQAAQQVAAIAANNMDTIDPAKLITAVEAYATAHPDTQAQVKTLLGIS
jgi:hypothetical protein